MSGTSWRPAMLSGLFVGLLVLWIGVAHLQASEDKRSAEDAEIARLAGTWVGFSYDYDGVKGHKFRSREGITITFSKRSEEFDGPGVVLDKTRLWKIDLGNPEAGGFGRSGGCTVDVSGPVGIITMSKGAIVADTILIYKLDDDVLSLRVLYNGKGKLELTADEGDGGIVFHLRRKPGGNKNSGRTPRVK